MNVVGKVATDLDFCGGAKAKHWKIFVNAFFQGRENLPKVKVIPNTKVYVAHYLSHSMFTSGPWYVGVAYVCI